MKKSGRFNFVIGFILGAVMFGGSVAFAAGIMATPSTNKIIVDDKEVKVEAYAIEGRNYLQLRDMAAAVGFSVVWDGANNQVLIDTTKGYDPNETLPASTSTPAPTATQTPAATTGGYGTVYNPLKTGDIVKTEPVDGSKGSVGGDYVIEKGQEDKPWKTSEGITWPNVALPAWQSEWDSYSRVSFPDQPPVHFTGEIRGSTYDRLLVFNPYEVERMIRTIYKYAKQNPSLWKDRDPSTNIPNFTIKIEYADDMAYNTFYPWRDWEIEKQVTSTGGGKVFRIFAYDTYNKGEFIDTEYFMK